MFSQIYGWFSSQDGNNQAEPLQEGAADDASASGVENRSSSRLTSRQAENDWILIDHRDERDSEGNSEYSDQYDDDNVVVVEAAPDRVVVRNRYLSPLPTTPTTALLTRTNSSGSLPPMPSTIMEESWFLTPPPCFISTGPIHMETSPLENLLIEHPSMSVYNHHKLSTQHHHTIPNSLESSSDVVVVEEEDEEAVVVNESVLITEQEIVDDEDVQDVVLVRRTPRLNRLDVFTQQERQGLQSKYAQKVQIQKACKAYQRGNMDRNNKAREVNCRNRRQRRGERSQGAKRSFANNNRKC